MATRAQVEHTLAELIQRLDSSDMSDRSLPDDRVLVCHIRDMDLYYRGVFSDGRISDLVAVDKRPRDGHVAITVSGDDLVALAQGRLSPVFAFLSGKLRVDAGARDLMLIRQLF